MLKHIAAILRTYESPRWDIFPEFELYMDQLLGCMGSSPEIREDNKESPDERFQMTAHRVNNYVKQGYLPPPVNRRYSRDHLARLYVLKMTKGAVPLPLLANAIERLSSQKTARQFSERFAEITDGVLKKIADALEAQTIFEGESESELDYYALTLAAEANALAMVSETILSRNAQRLNQSAVSNSDSSLDSDSSER